MSLSRALCSRCASSSSLVPIAAVAAPRLGSVAHFASIAQSNDGQERPHPPRKAVGKPQKRGKGKGVHGNRSIDLFNSVISEGSRTRDTSASSSSSSSPNSEAPVRAGRLYAHELTAGLDELKKSKDDIKTRCDRFAHEYWPSIRAHGFPLPKPLYESMRDCLVRLCQDLAVEPLGPSSRRVCTRLSTTLLSSAMYDVGMHTGLILNLCLALSRGEGISSMERGDLLSDILNMWMAVSSMKRSGPVRRNPNFIFPDAAQLAENIETLKVQSINEQEDSTADYTSTAMMAIFPQFDPRQSFRAVPGLLATLAVFSRSMTPNLVAKAGPLLQVLHLALREAKVDDEYLKTVFSKRNLTHHGKHADELQAMVADAWENVQAWIDDPSVWAAASKPPRPTTLSSIHGDLRKAYAAGDKQGISRTWQQLNRNIASNPALEAELRNDPAHIDFWFFIWCALGRENMLPDTEALMEKVQHQPTIKTYTAMMHGWKMSKKYDSISLLWERLQSSGIKLDRHIWTERISALIDLGRPQEGVAALGHMMNAWKANPEREVEPTIEVINAAFDGIIRRDKKAAFEILGWAGTAGIKPDILTFNILLRESAKTEGEIPRLLKEMKDAGIEPDEGTFTIIMDEVVGAMAGSSEGELVSGIGSIFNIVDASGLKLNQEMYAKILHVVVSRLEGSDQAVEAVLKSMADRGHNKISPHMLLILLQRLMREDDASSAAIDKLLRQYGFSSIASGDQRLWEHVIRSYANVGDSANALRVYDELAGAGRPATSLYCLKDLLQVLLEDSRDEDVARVVDRTLEDMQRRAGERNWRHRFWHMAHQSGLLRGKTLPVDLEKALRER